MEDLMSLVDLRDNEPQHGYPSCDGPDGLSRASLLDLPVHVRQRILRLSMAPSQNGAVRYRRLDLEDDGDLLSTPVPTSNVNCLLVCRQLKKDAEEIFYGSGHFVLDGRNTQDFRQLFTPGALQSITTLEISYSRSDRHTAPPNTAEEANTFPEVLLPESRNLFLGLSQTHFPSSNPSDLDLFRAWDVKSSIVCALPSLRTLIVNFSSCTYGQSQSGTHWVMCRLVGLHAQRLLKSRKTRPALEVVVVGENRLRFDVLLNAMGFYGSGGIGLSYKDDWAARNGYYGP
ncbi:MAG: hypothetical protein M1822_010141 [Bathelium mastoideum]|nr:MAG: hypothetical protein M1822_010141 [Bathelium mastoideum]